MSYGPHLNRLEQKYRLPPGLMGAVMRAESGGNPSARSPVGAVGLMQLMPATAAGLGVDPYDPIQNLEGGAKYLRQQLDRFGGRVDYALAAYNAGPGAVEKYGGIPPYAETKTYVQRVNGFWKESRQYGKQPSAAGVQSTPQQSTSKNVYQVDPARTAKLQHAWSDAPANAGLRVQREYDRQDASMQAAAQAPQQQGAFGGGSPAAAGKSGWYKTPGGWVQDWRDGEKGWQFLQRLGSGFGLENDPGTTQTYGGRHSDGSLHYKDMAIDYGNARNTNEQLQAWYDWLKPRQERIGIDELIWQAPDHYNHAHVGLRPRS